MLESTPRGQTHRSTCDLAQTSGLTGGYLNRLRVWFIVAEGPITELIAFSRRRSARAKLANSLLARQHLLTNNTKPLSLWRNYLKSFLAENQCITCGIRHEHGT